MVHTLSNLSFLFIYIYETEFLIRRLENGILKLSTLAGEYSIDIDAKQGRIKIFGEVDPNVLLKAIARTGRHAKVVWARMNHPSVNRSYHGGADYDSGYGYGYGYGYRSSALEDSNGGYYGRGALPSSSGHDTTAHCHHYYPMRRSVPDYHYPSYYSDHRFPAAAMHVPSYPSPVYDPYQDDSISLCNIM